MGSKSKKRSKDLMKKMLNEEAYGSQGPVSEQEFLHKYRDSTTKSKNYPNAAEYQDSTSKNICLELY